MIGHCLLYISTVKPHIFNTDTEGAIESVRINGVSILSRLNLEKI